MDKSKILEKVAVMLAYANGKAIEWKNKTFPDEYTKWIYDFEPSWDWSRIDYRVCAEVQVKFHIPTKDEFEDLISNFTRWNAKKKGLEIQNESGEILFLPVTGYYSGTKIYNVDSDGLYWSSTMYEKDYAYILYFDSRNMGTSPNHHCCDRNVVRLVSDVPFEGGIKFGNIYWKPENEKGYYSWGDAMSKFNV